MYIYVAPFSVVYYAVRCQSIWAVLCQLFWWDEDALSCRRGSDDETRSSSCFPSCDDVTRACVVTGAVDIGGGGGDGRLASGPPLPPARPRPLPHAARHRGRVRPLHVSRDALRHGVARHVGHRARLEHPLQGARRDLPAGRRDPRRCERPRRDDHEG